MGDLDGLYRELEGQVRREQGPRAWLRERSTPVRGTIALGTITALTVAVWLSWARPDLGSYPGWHMALTLGAIGAVLVCALAIGLRPLHMPEAPAWLSRLVLGGGLVLLFAVYMLPAGAHAATHGDGLPGVLHGAWKCFGTGAVLGLPVYVLLRLLDRGSSPYGVATALAAGLSANLLLQLHCPNSAPQHMVLGHLTVAFVFGLVYVAYRRVASIYRVPS